MAKFIDYKLDNDYTYKEIGVTTEIANLYIYMTSCGCDGIIEETLKKNSYKYKKLNNEERSRILKPLVEDNVYEVVDQNAENYNDAVKVIEYIMKDLIGEKYLIDRFKADKNYFNYNKLISDKKLEVIKNITKSFNKKITDCLITDDVVKVIIDYHVEEGSYHQDILDCSNYVIQSLKVYPDIKDNKDNDNIYQSIATDYNAATNSNSLNAADVEKIISQHYQQPQDDKELVGVNYDSLVME